MTNQLKERDSNSLKRYFRGVKAEFKRVVWPSKQQLANYTGIVIAVSIVTALLIYAIDYVVQFLFSLFLGA